MKCSRWVQIFRWNWELSALSAGYGLIDEKVAKINTEIQKPLNCRKRVLYICCTKFFWAQFAAKLIFGAQFAKQKFSGAKFARAQFARAHLSGPNMPGPIYLKKMPEAWFAKNPLNNPSIRLSVSPQKIFHLLFLLLLCLLWTILSAPSSSSPPN